METTRFRKVMCANRGEIAIRVFRACTELGLRTVGIFSEEDRTHQFRYKADEAYLVGRGKKPIDAYLGIDEILDVAVRAKVDAIHPGYGFLSENAEFAAACARRGVRFIGPSPDIVRLMGDKILARELAQKAGVPVVPGFTLDLGQPDALAQAREFTAKHAPVLVKAAHGGGGRGMRVVRRVEELDELLAQAASEAKSAFGSGVVFLEKFLERVRHIEVQVLGDHHGNLVHLYERDCSVQRRHQKIIEVAPAWQLDPFVRTQLLHDALRIARACGYTNAGTVEFLVAGRDHWFIEVNPRLQVEHTVTEQVTGIDLVQAQIRVAEGHALPSAEIGIPSQDAIAARGYAIQCRVTTEDPKNHFLPDTGKINVFRAATGPGIRIDGGNGYSGAYVSPHYDSLLIKVVGYANTFALAVRKSIRSLQETRVRGVKTNIPFLENVLRHEHFQNGTTWTRFLDDTPELFQLTTRRDRATKLLAYLGHVVVNGHPTVKPNQRRKPTAFVAAPVPVVPDTPPPPGSAQILAERGPEGLARWVLEQRRPLLTDTTMRDAHQSLLATRVRTFDVLKIAPAVAHLAPELFSLESWGGATFDVAYRFLDEDPWERLRQLKAAVPNILQQMLLRGANAVGYTSYPNNVVEAFVDEAAAAGIDVFRVFDSLNDLDSMRVSVRRILATGKVAEVAMCYTGDVANPSRRKYTLEYYAELARRIEDLGAHILCIKDMAGLLRPRAAEMLITRLRETTGLPIHLHTHDTSGNGVATLLEAIRCGAHIVDVALAPMAGTTSQPSMNALVAALRGGERETTLTNKRLQPLANYWEVVREYYAPFESGLLHSTSEVYYHEIPGGQYSNLRPQVAELGLLERWNDVKDAFAVVNLLVGDIPKVTPSSKMVGDFAMFLVKNGLLVRRDEFDAMVRATRERVLAEAARLNFPESVVQYFQGQLGHPPGGFPEDLRKAVLKGLPTVSGNPGDTLPPIDLEQLAVTLSAKHGRAVSRRDALSAALYPRVVDEFLAFRNAYEDVSLLDTPTYFYGMEIGQEIWVDLEPGKTLVITLVAVSDPHEDGTRTVFFELNGQPRNVRVRDRALAAKVQARPKAERGNTAHVGASMPGTVIAMHCKAGDAVHKGAPLLTLEAMKMETVLRAPRDGMVKQVLPALKSSVQTEDLVVVLE
ncbi:MAG: pyruvate carboxylase [Planctomycetes bacterium]|nr:pyruvate carboxylase [Planctomycetota bacterium]